MEIAQSIEEVLQAYLDGKTIVYNDMIWKKQGGYFPSVEQDEINLNSWSIKENTININDIEVPESCRSKPEIGKGYWYPDPTEKDFCSGYTWGNDSLDNDLFDSGWVHLTKDAARIHAEALISFTKLKDKNKTKKQNKMKLYSREAYLLSALKLNASRMPNGLSGKMIQYRTSDLDGKIFWHLPELADKINWTNRVIDDSGSMFTPQFLGCVYDYVVLEAA